MFDIITSTSRGSANHGWLRAKHTFSFADYHNPERVQFGPLRVINEDRIAPAAGFPTHPHRDMEILTYPISGAIEHKDSMGNGTVIEAGEVQRMTAGTGVRHSEYNHSDAEELHLLQIWIHPEENDLPPSYEQTRYSREDKLNQLRLIASRDGRDSSVTVHQDVSIYASILESQNELVHEVDAGRKTFLHVIHGAMSVNDVDLNGGDGVQITDETTLKLRANKDSEFLLFDMR